MYDVLCTTVYILHATLPDTSLHHAPRCAAGWSSRIVYIYIYIERERDIYIYIYIYMNIYIYTHHIYIYIEREIIYI